MEKNKDKKNIVIYSGNDIKDFNKYHNDTNDIVIFTEGKSDAEYLRKIFADNLKYYMDKNKKSKNDLTIDLKFKYSTVRDWVSGAKYPRMDKVQKLADYFNIEKSDLTEKKINTKIRIFNRIPAHKPINDINGCDGFEELPHDWFKDGKNYFGFNITDNSMLDEFKIRRFSYIREYKKL